MTVPIRVQPTIVEDEDPLEKFKRLKKAQTPRLRTPAVDPIEQFKALRASETPADPNAKLHEEYESGRLQGRIDRQNLNDEEWAEAGDPVSAPMGYVRRALGAGAALMSDIPGGEAAQAGLRSVVRRQPYTEALDDLRSMKDETPFAATLLARGLGGVAAIGSGARFLPGGAFSSGAVVGGASGALDADPKSLGMRAGGTVGGAATGGLIGKAFQLGGQAVKKVADVTGATEAISRGATKLADKISSPVWKGRLKAFGTSTGSRGTAAEKIAERLESEPAGIRGTADDVAKSMKEIEKPELLADYSPEAASLTKSVTKVPGAGRAQVTKELVDRANDTATRMSRDLAKASANEPGRDARGILEKLAESREVTAAAKFPKAYKAGVDGIDDPAIREILGRPTFAKLYEKAKTMAGDEGRSLPFRIELKAPPAVQKMIEETAPNLRAALVEKLKASGALTPVEVPVPDVKTVHYVDRALRRAIEEGFEGKGPIVDPSHATELSKVFGDLRDKMTARVPEYADALKHYANDSRKIEALQTGLKVLTWVRGDRVAPGAMQAGESLVLKTGRRGIEGLEKSVSQMTPREQFLFRQGARQALFDELAAAEPTTAGSTQAVISKIFGRSKDSQRWHDLLFKTPAEAEAFQKQLAREARMRATNARMGGSDTAENLNEKEQIVGDLEVPTGFRRLAGKALGMKKQEYTDDVYRALGDRLSATGTRLTPMLGGVKRDVKNRKLRTDLLNLIRNAAVADATGREFPR